MANKYVYGEMYFNHVNSGEAVPQIARKCIYSGNVSWLLFGYDFKNEIGWSSVTANTVTFLELNINDLINKMRDVKYSSDNIKHVFYSDLLDNTST